MAHHRCRTDYSIRPKPARQVRPAPACPPRVAYRLDRQLFVLKIARAIHAAILLHQLFQIELSCDLGHIALTVLIRRIASRQPHPLFIERFERSAVDIALVLAVDRNWLAFPSLTHVSHPNDGEKTRK